MSTETPAVYTFTGQPGEHYNGVPARDLTEEDVAALTDEQRALLDEGTLYAPVAQRTSRSRSKAKTEEPAEPDTTETTDTPPATPAPEEG